MSDKKKTFSDLLSEAPLAVTEDTVSMVGALSRSSQPDKFVLTTPQGQAFTFNTSAVKKHQVLGGGVGQLLVQLDVDREQVPAEAQAAFKPSGPIQSGLPDLKHPILEKHPALDKYPWEEPVRFPPEAVAASPAGLGIGHTGYHDVKHPIADKYPWEEPARTHPEGGSEHTLPFALATPQQAPASSLEAMYGAAGSFGKTVLHFDVGGTGYRDLPKHPWLDATGRPPYLD